MKKMKDGGEEEINKGGKKERRRNKEESKTEWVRGDMRVRKKGTMEGRDAR